MLDKICFGVQLAALSVIATNLKWSQPQPSGNDVINVMVLILYFVVIVREVILYVEND